MQQQKILNHCPGKTQEIKSVTLIQHV